MPHRDQAFSQLLNEVIGRRLLGKQTVPKIASIMSVSESTIYDYRSDRTEPSYSKIKALSDALCKKGYFKLAMQFWPHNGRGKSNGSIDDQITGSVRALGMADEAEEERDKDKLLNAIGKLEQEVQNMKAEARKL